MVMKKLAKILVVVVSVSFLFACSSPAKGTPDVSQDNQVATIVAATMAALTPSAQPTTEVMEASSTPSVTVEQPTPTATATATSTPTPTSTAGASPTPTNTPIPKPGTIAGAITGYPYGSIPALIVVAFEQEAPFNYSYFITTPGTTSYSIDGEYVIPGQWIVVAYDASGNSGGCPSTVKVKSEETVTCDITDWAGSYPAKPAGVPEP